MAGITETAGHCALRSCALPPVIGRAGSPSGLRTTRTPAVSAVRPPVPRLRYHISRPWIPSKTSRPSMAGQPCGAMTASCLTTVAQRCSSPRPEAGLFRTLPGPPGKRLILSGKLPVRDLPRAKRRDAEAAGRSALDRELRGDSMPGAGGQPDGSRKRGLSGCVTAGTAWRRVRGERRCGGGPRRASPTQRQRAWAAAPHRRDSPAAPNRLRREPSPIQRSPWVHPAPMLGARPGPDARRRISEALRQERPERPTPTG